MKELKDNFKGIYVGLENMQRDFTDIKIMIHSLDKLGLNVEDMYKQVDNLGIELKKLKDLNMKKYKERGFKNGEKIYFKCRVK